MGKHQVIIDRPASKGGSDRGLMGGELFLSAIGGCLIINLLAAIKARDVEVSDVRVAVTGGIVDSPARFVAVDVYVAAENGSPELLERLVKIPDHGCIMIDTLRGKVDLTIRIGATRPLVGI